jgi:hypothetical protein
MVYQLITVTQTALTKQLVEEVDYGNAASDINPDDIESINVLKLLLPHFTVLVLFGVVMIVMKKVETEKVLV